MPNGDAYQKWLQRLGGAPDSSPVESTPPRARSSTYDMWNERLSAVPRPVFPHEDPAALGEPEEPEEPRSWIAKRFPKARQALYGVVDAGLRLGEGLTQNAANVIPGRDPFQRASDFIERQRLGMEERTAPTDTGEMLARVGGNLLFEGGEYVVGGAAGRKLAGPVVQKIGERIAPRLTAKLAGSKGVLSEAAKDAAAVAPIDLAATAVGPENSTLGAIAALTKNRYEADDERLRARLMRGLSDVTEAASENPLSRFAGEVLIGGSADVALRGTARGVKSLAGPGVPSPADLRAAREGTTVLPPVDIPTPPPDMAARVREAYGPMQPVEEVPPAPGMGRDFNERRRGPRIPPSEFDVAPEPEPVAIREPEVVPEPVRAQEIEPTAPVAAEQLYRQEDVLGMDATELEQAATVLKEQEASDARAVLGDRAEEYERAQRIVNGSTDPHSERYKAAERAIQEMESGLTPEQEKRLFGIGMQDYVGHEDVRGLARSARNYSDEVLADESTDGLLQSFARLAGGDRGTEDLMVLYALPRIARELSRRGVPDGKLIAATLERMGQRGIDSGNAGEALAFRMKQWREKFGGGATPKNPDVAPESRQVTAGPPSMAPPTTSTLPDPDQAARRRPRLRGSDEVRGTDARLGASDPALVGALGRTAVGATGGAVLAPEGQKVEGALAGGAVGLAGPAALRGARRMGTAGHLVGPRRTPEATRAMVEELVDNGARVHDDGTVTVYHRTTKEAADEIARSGKMVGREDGVFFSTSPSGQAEGFGDAVVELRVPTEALELDDVFGSEAHVRIPTRKAGQGVDVSKWLPGASERVAGEAVPGAPPPRAAWESERDVAARVERLAGVKPRGTYDEIQKLIDDRETTLEASGWDPVRDPITDTELQRLYDERDAVGAVEEEGVFSQIAEKIPNGPAPKSFLVEHARRLYDSYTQSERLSGKIANLKPEDVQEIAQGLYTTILHRVSPGGHGYPGNFLDAVDVARDFSNSGWGTNPRPLVEQAIGTLKAFGLGADNLPAIGRGSRQGAALPEVTGALARTGVGALAGGAAASGEGGLTPAEGALAGAVALGAGPVVAKRLAGPKLVKGPSRFASDPNIAAVRATRQKAAASTTSFLDRLKADPTKPLRRVRQGVTRAVAGLERYGRIVGGTDELARTAAEGRGWLPASEMHAVENLTPVVRKVEEAGADDVKDLLIAERDIELRANGYGAKTPVTDAQLQAAVQRLSAVPEVRAAADEVRGYFRKLLEMKRDEGVITPEQFKEITDKGQYYVPFVRDLEDRVVQAGGTTKYNRSSGVRRMKEGDVVADLTIMDPLEMAVLDTHETIRRVHKARVTNLVAKFAEEYPNVAATFIRELSPVEIRRITGAVPEQVALEGMAPPRTTKKVTPRRMSGPEPTRNGIIIDPIVNGQRRYYEVIDEELADAFASLGPEGQAALTSVFAKVAGMMRMGVVFHPAFAVANALRDLGFTALSRELPGGTARAGGAAAVGAGVGAAVSEDPAEGALLGATVAVLPFGGLHLLRLAAENTAAMKDILGPQATGAVLGGTAGALSADDEGESATLRFIAGALVGGGAGRLAGKMGVKKSGAYERFMAGGGGQFGFFGNRGEKNAAQLVGRMAEGGDVLRPRSIGELVNWISHAVETAPRLAYYKRTGDIAGARDLSLDFAVRGSSRSVSGLTKSTAFLNPALQGVDKWARMLGKKNTYAVGLATMTAPAIALYEINKDNPEYQNIPLYQKALYYHIPKPGGGFFKVPKPFEPGALFGTAPEMAMAFAETGDTEALKATGTVLARQYGPESFLPIPTAVAGPMEALVNYDTFRRRSIDPNPWSDIDPAYQYDENTSSIALALNKVPGLGGVSPARIDHILQSLTGTLGRDIATKVTEAARATGLDERREPAGRSRQIMSRFHSSEGGVGEIELAWRRTISKNERAYNTTRTLFNDGQEAEAKKYLLAHRDEVAEYLRYKDVDKFLALVSKTRGAIYESEAARDEKTRLLENLNRAVAEMLRAPTAEDPAGKLAGLER